jgi:hypothetical protein
MPAFAYEMSGKRLATVGYATGDAPSGPAPAVERQGATASVGP